MICRYVLYSEDSQFASLGIALLKAVALEVSTVTDAQAWAAVVHAVQEATACQTLVEVLTGQSDG